MIAYRKALMVTNQQHMNSLRALLSDEINLPIHILRHTGALETNGRMLANVFPEGSTHPNSRALDEIWTEPDEFRERLQAFARATENLNAIAQRGFNDQTQTALAWVQQACEACHNSFRRPVQPAGGG